MGFYEHGNKSSGFIKGERFIDELSDDRFPQKGSVPWSQFHIKIDTDHTETVLWFYYIPVTTKMHKIHQDGPSPNMFVDRAMDSDVPSRLRWTLFRYLENHMGQSYIALMTGRSDVVTYVCGDIFKSINESSREI